MSKINFQMRDDRMAILVDPDQEVSAGGIVLPKSGTGEKFTLKGTVVAVGPGKRDYNSNWRERIPTGVKAGDRVMFSEYVGNVSMIDGVKYHILREDDLLATINPPVVE